MSPGTVLPTVPKLFTYLIVPVPWDFFSVNFISELVSFELLSFQLSHCLLFDNIISPKMWTKEPFKSGNKQRMKI